MRAPRKTALALLLALAGCANQPKLVMLNPRTGVSVNCPIPDPTAGSGGFLISRACLSACEAHGFRPMPDQRPPTGDDETPAVCNN